MYRRRSTFVPRSWMCKKQTSVFHSSIESEIISLDAGLRMDGIPALDLWDVVIEVLHSSNNKKSSIQEASGNRSGFKESAGNCLRMSCSKLGKGNQNVEQLSDLDHVTTNETSSHNVKRGCTFLKTTRQWSRLSSKDEAQWWDTCQGPTELRKVGCLTESTWTQKSKSKLLTPKNNSLTCWPQEVLRVMNGAIFFVCLASWICLCSFAAIFVQVKGKHHV